jgi:glycosyltransferase involved in cell wall biosynthesis
VLTVSAKRAHKNLERLIDAAKRLAAERDLVLVVPGYATPDERSLEAHAAAVGVRDSVCFTGWLDDATLEGLYRAADCFVFPSLAEGFGLPLLEAMARGTPVATSNATSLPEIGGDAVEYFEPTDTDAIAATIARILDDPALRERMAVSGPRRAAEFTWEGTAESTLRCYDRALRRSTASK